MSESDRAWYEEAFGELYPLVYAHRSDEGARREVAFVCEVLELPASSRVLDVGCGGGRHLRALAEQGHRAVGIDLSRPLLARADGGNVVRADMRALPFASAAFDAAASFFTSFAFFPTPEEDRRVLAEIARVVQPGGRYFLDYLDADVVRKTLVPTSAREVNGLAVRERRRIEGGRVKKRVIISRAGEELARYEESVRLYPRDQVLSMLRDVGFEPWKTFGGFERDAVGEGSRFLVASRRSTA